MKIATKCAALCAATMSLAALAVGPVSAAPDWGAAPSTVLAPPARPVFSGPRNFLSNPNFDIPAAPGWVVNRHLHPGDGIEAGGGASAASSWTTWVATPGPGEVATEVVRSPLTGGKMIHVKLSGTGVGLVQTALPEHTGPEKTYACTWVLVTRGRVGLGAGDGGSTSLTAYSKLVGKWERLEARNSTSPVNELIIYGEPGSEFYVENAVLSDVWPPSGCEAR